MEDRGAGQAAMGASLRFGDDPVQYERARPPHAAWVFDALLDGLGPCRVLDVGCGTGLAGLELRRRGCEVLGVERDERMAAVAIARGLNVDIAAFERWHPDGREFDLICSAQAWHWIDVGVGLDIVARALRPGGRFGAFWYGHRHDPEVAAVLRAARGLARVEPPTERPDPGAPTVAALMDRPDMFTEVQSQRGTATIPFTADAWLEFEASLGTIRAIPDDERRRLFGAIHEAITAIQPIAVHWDTTLVTATRHTQG